jgi:hypothetical protein
MKTTRINRHLAIFVAIIMALTLWTGLPLQEAWAASSDAQIEMDDPSPPNSGTGWSYSNGVYYVTGSNVLVLGDNGTSGRRVEVPAGESASIILAAQITAPIEDNNQAPPTDNRSPITVKSGASLELIVSSDDCKLIGEFKNAGLRVEPGASLTIRDPGGNPGPGMTYKLTAQGGGRGGAGIGGAGIAGYTTSADGFPLSTGSITIQGNVEVVATGGGAGAGIGGGEVGGGTMQPYSGEIFIKGGTVTATAGGAASVGIGCPTNATANTGTVTISGGTVTAIGKDHGPGIGGGGNGGTVNITGGTVTATSIGPTTSGIGVWNDGLFTLNGDAVVFATVGDGVSTLTKGILFKDDDGKSGTVYGTVTMPDNVTIPSGTTLTIPAGKTLNIPSSKTLTISSGAELINQGTINGPGSIANSGTINNTGTINSNCNVSGNSVISKPAITTTSPLPAGTYNSAYSQSLAATGGGTITWTKVSDDLPAGLSLSAGGVISGNPTAVTSKIFTVRATNSAGYGEKDFFIVINQAAGALAGAPEENSKTASSITLKAVTLPLNPGSQAVEYAKNTTNSAPTDGWQEGLTFSTGLLPNTGYYFFARAKENTNYATGTASSGKLITTGKAELSGTVSITGTPTYNETLTANTDSLTKDATSIGAAGLGDLSYQWKRDGGNITSATKSTYKLVADDVGKKITVTVSAANCLKDVTSNETNAVAKKSLTFTGTVTATKVYDGNVNFSNEKISIDDTSNFSDKVTGDVVTLSKTGVTGTLGSKNVTTTGQNLTVSGTFTLMGANAGNYTLSAQPPVTVSITAKPISFAGNVTATKVYDGDANFSNEQISIDDDKDFPDKVDGDIVTLSKEGVTGSLGSKNVTPGSTLGVSGAFALAGVDAGNYSFSAQPDVTASITAKSISFAGTVTATKVYDGTVDFSTEQISIQNGGNFPDKVEGDTVTLIKTDVTGKLGSKNVTTGSTLIRSGDFALDGTDKGNYSLSAQPDVKANIAAKTIGINVAVNDKKYDGLDTATFDATPTLNGNILTDDVILTNGIPTFNDVNVNTGIKINFTDFSIDGTDAKNYSLTQPSGITADITDGFTPVESTHYKLSAIDGEHGWYSGSNFVITAKEGYKVSKENKDNSDWQDSLTYSADTANTDVDFYMRDVGTNEISVKKTVSYKKDSVVPSGTVTVNSNAFTEFLQTTTFGLFYKDKVEVTVSASDTLSGLAKIYYLKTGIVHETGSAISAQSWQDGGAIIDSKIEFSVDRDEWDAEQFNKKFFVYAKLVDNAGNAHYLRSDGTVIYTDSEQDTKSISFTKTSMNDVEASVHLNGNTIKEIKNSTNSAILTPTDHYTVDDSTITFKVTYLDSLAADDYELEISYNPGGETFSSGDSPNTTSIDVTVSKAAQNDLSITDLEESYTYGDEPFEIGTSGGSGTGDVTFASDHEDVASVETLDGVGTVTIHKIGTFKITATKAADNDYEQASVESGEITVNAKELTVEDIAFNNKIYDGTTNPPTMSGTPRLDGVVHSDDVSLDDSKVTYAFVNANVAPSVTINRNGKYELTGDNDDISNYTLTQPEGPFSASITQRPLVFEGTVTATKRYDGNANFTAEEIEIEEPTNFDNVVPAETVTLDETNAEGSLESENVGSGVLELTADFTLSGTTAANYALTEQPEVTASITQAEPQLITWPTVKPITYGIKLSTVELDGGEGDGEFAWTDGTIIPTVAGKGYEVTFTPRDADNYDYSEVVLTQITAIKVNPAAGSFGSPDAINTTYASGLTLADLKLPSGYAWDAPETALVVGDGQSFPATYIHSSGNYTAASGNITVNVAKDDAQDMDGDGVPDYIEEQQGTDPTDKADAKDTDGDGVPDYIEEQQGTDPTDKTDMKDTDGDGVPDYVEEQQGTDPAEKDDAKDTDGDGVPDYIEEQQGTDPADKNDFKDADGNGVPDYIHPPSGWVYENGAWKYFVAGEAATGWLYDTNYKAWFSLGRDGAMQTGWVYDRKNKAWYYLAGNGKMVAGKWLHDTDGRWYYLSGNGKMVTGKQNIGGKVYSFRGNGAWVG